MHDVFTLPHRSWSLFLFFRNTVSISWTCISMGRSSSNRYFTINLLVLSYSLPNADFDFKYFWAWTDFQSYLDFMLAIWLIGAIITFFMLPYMWFNEIMGFLAVFIEAMLGKCYNFSAHPPSYSLFTHRHIKSIFNYIHLIYQCCCCYCCMFSNVTPGAPQFLRNFNNKSTQGMSIVMVVFWTIGDMFKTGYFVARSAPTQFWICGTLQVSSLPTIVSAFPLSPAQHCNSKLMLCFPFNFSKTQVSLDLLILSQVFLYRKNTESRSSHRID